MSTTEIAEFVIKINLYSGLPGILFFVSFLLTKKSNIRIVFYVILVSFLADLAVEYYVRNVYPNSYGVTATWVMVNYVLVSWFFRSLMPSKKKLISILLVVFLGGALISYIFFFSFQESNTFIKSYSSVIFTYLSISAFLEVLKEGPTQKLIQYPIFWIITGIFLFSSVSLLKNLFQHYLVFDLQVSKDLYLYVWFFAVGFNIIKNLMFFYAFILCKRGNPDYIYQPNNITS